MIILDEQLQDPDLVAAIRRWHRAVRNIKEFRPGGEIADENIPALLREQRGCTFVTNDHDDFWRKVDGHADFCIVCFALPSSRIGEISPLLRRAFHLDPFRTERRRGGKILQVQSHAVEYYERASDPGVRLEWPR